jgi:hypothetical protein
MLDLQHGQWVTFSEGGQTRTGILSDDKCTVVEDGSTTREVLHLGKPHLVAVNSISAGWHEPMSQLLPLHMLQWAPTLYGRKWPQACFSLPGRVDPCHRWSYF